MLVNKAHVRAGQTILIHAAGSAVSVAAIQIAKKFGMQIIVTSTSEQKLARARGLGAHRFIDTSRSLISDDVRNMTGKAGVDVVVDHIGGGSIMESVRCLKKGGVLVSCGATAGSDVKLDWKHVFFKNIALLGSTYGPAGAFRSVMEAFEAKELSAVIDQRVPFAELGAAHRLIEERKVFGKVVVTL
jgi:NADPH:quinone reductase-like Zn-dependent oxidoreductase